MPSHVLLSCCDLSSKALLILQDTKLQGHLCEACLVLLVPTLADLISNPHPFHRYHAINYFTCLPLPLECERVEDRNGVCFPVVFLAQGMVFEAQ